MPCLAFSYSKGIKQAHSDLGWSKYPNLMRRKKYFRNTQLKKLVISLDFFYTYSIVLKLVIVITIWILRHM